MSTQIFVNLPVKDLDKSMAFYKNLGFEFNPKFTDETAACMVISEANYAMLLTHEKFAGFGPNPIGDAHAQTAVMIAISLDSREAVDDMTAKAVASGGKTFRDVEDHGFMYGHAFQDPDGHVWEPFFMEPDAMPRS